MRRVNQPGQLFSIIDLFVISKEALIRRFPMINDLIVYTISHAENRHIQKVYMQMGYYSKIFTFVRLIFICTSARQITT